MSDAGFDEDDDAAVAAEYALGLLTPAEVAAFEARLEVDPAFRDLAARWAEDLAGLALAIPEVAPPPGLEGRIMQRLFPEERRSLLSRLGLPTLLGGALAALLLAVVGSGLLRRDAPDFLAEAAAADGSLVVAASFDADAGTVVVERQAGALAAGRAQQLWLIPEGGAPVALGLLPEDGEATLAVAPALLAPGAQLAVSDEPPGGSTTGAPTGAVLAIGPITTR